MILNPNCSEIVWRLNIPYGNSIKEKIINSLENNKNGIESTGTDGYPNSCVDTIIGLLEGYSGDVENTDLEFIENRGGGGNWDYVEKCLEIAKKHIKGEITKEEAEKLEEKAWN